MKSLRMLKNGPVILLLSLGVFLISACGKSKEKPAAPETPPAAETAAAETAAPPITNAYAGWVEYGSEPDGFTILTPKSFDLYRAKTPTDAGEIEIITYLAEMPTVAYGVVCNDFPEEFMAKTDPNLLLKNGGKGFVDKLNGTLTGERLLSKGGIAGLEITMKGIQQEVELFGKARFYIVGNRLYQVAAMAEKGKENLPEIDYFLDSFKLK